MIRYGYTILIETLPPDIDPVWFITEFGAACRHVEQATGEAVRFVDRLSLSSGQRAAIPNAQWLYVGFGDMDHITDGSCCIGEKRTRSDGAQSITFSNQTKWATRWWHRLFTWRQNLQVIARHELGHALGLGHSPQSMGSVMAPNPVNSDFLSFERAILRDKLAGVG